MLSEEEDGSPRDNVSVALVPSPPPREAGTHVQLQWPFCPGWAWVKALAGFEERLTQLPTSRGANPPALLNSRADTSVGASACCARL